MRKNRADFLLKKTVQVSFLTLLLLLFTALPAWAVTVEGERYLLTGGQSIGVLLQTDGVTVVGHSPIVSADGDSYCPAKEAGLQVGDFITAINGQKVTDNLEVADLICQSGSEGRQVTVDYLRGDIAHKATLTPLYCSDTQSWRSGLYIRDNTAGVGTLTYYDPSDGSFGALGHKICVTDPLAGDPAGYIVPAAISAVKAGSKGVPGEKVGVFLTGSWQGSIELNSDLGVFGTLDAAGPVNDCFPQLLAVADPSEAQLGAAEICTVIDGEQIEKFTIEIEKIYPNNADNGKGMVISVTDEALLQKTGGIIQGMSGSPIIQNGKLLGAVTHVFVNEPQKGYACFALWMLEEYEG